MPLGCVNGGGISASFSDQMFYVFALGQLEGADFPLSIFGAVTIVANGGAARLNLDTPDSPVNGPLKISASAIQGTTLQGQQAPLSDGPR